MNHSPIWITALTIVFASACGGSQGRVDPRGDQVAPTYDPDNVALYAQELCYLASEAIEIPGAMQVDMLNNDIESFSDDFLAWWREGESPRPVESYEAFVEAMELIDPTYECYELGALFWNAPPPSPELANDAEMFCMVAAEFIGMEETPDYGTYLDTVTMRAENMDTNLFVQSLRGMDPEDALAKIDSFSLRAGLEEWQCYDVRELMFRY